jgi:DNA-binding transcriptional regulator YhcF (GntR family)
VAEKEFKYIQVVRGIVEDLTPELELGERLPALPELCARYGVSEITVKKALRLLAEQEMVKRVPGKGTILLRRPQRGWQPIAAKPVNLTVLALKDWTFSKAFAAFLGKFCSLNPHVSFEQVTVSEDDWRSTVQSRSFDLALVNTWCLRESLTDSGLQAKFLPLDRPPGLWLPEDAYFPEVLRWCANRRGLFCFPVTFSPVVSLLNRDYPGMKSARCSGDMLLGDFVALMQNLKSSDDKRRYPFYLRMMLNRWPSILRMLGADLFSEDGRTCLLDTPEAIRAISQIVNLLHEQAICPPLVALDTNSQAPDNPELFATGEFACSWVTYNDLRHSYSFATEYVPLPQSQEKPAHLLIEGVMVGRGTRQQDVIREILNFIQLSDHQTALSEQCDGISAQIKTANAIAGELAQQREGAEWFTKALDYARPAVTAPRWQLCSHLARRLHPVWLGVQSPEDICRGVAKEVNRELASTKTSFVL